MVIRTTFDEVCPGRISKEQANVGKSRLEVEQTENEGGKVNDYHGLLQHHRSRDLPDPADPDRRDHAAARQDVQQHGQGFLSIPEVF